MLAARLADSRAATLSVWLWFAGLAVVTALLVPGFSPYFLFPAMLAALIALAAALLPGAARQWLSDIAFALPTLLALVIWLSLVATGEGLMGLKLHPLFTLPAALAAMTLVPLIHAPAMRRGVWLGLIAASLGGALVATVIAGVQPAFSKTIAQRLSMRYVEDAATKQASWVVDAAAPLPASLRAAAAFSQTPVQALPAPFPLTYSAPAGAARYPAPRAEIVADGAFEGGRRITVALHGSADASSMGVLIPKAAKVRAIDIHGQHLVAPESNDGDTLLACASRDCASEVVSIETATRAGFPLTIVEQRYGLPDFAAPLVAARPRQAVPSQNGDVVFLMSKLDIPAK